MKRAAVTLDTNVFIRYLVRDDEVLYGKAKKVFLEIADGKVIGRVSLLVLNEVTWVLKRYYGLARAAYIPELRKLFSLEGIEFVEVKKGLVMELLEIMEAINFNVTDIYLSLITDKKDMVSFDKDFEKLYKRKQ